MRALKRFFLPAAMALAMVLTFMMPADALLKFNATTGDVYCTGGCSMSVYSDGGVVFQDSAGNTLEISADGTWYYNGF